MKKKKKKSSKKLDLEAFEKELNEAKAKEDPDDEGDDGEGLAEIDEAELGDDPFAQGADAPTGLDAGNEPWLKSDRDYTYPEVHFPLQSLPNYQLVIKPSTAFTAFLRISARFQPLTPNIDWQALHNCSSIHPQRRQQKVHLRKRHRHLQANAQTARACHSVLIC
jgi:hypothetical protein